MASRYRKKPLKTVEDKIIQLFLKKDRHLLIGEVAIALNIHLEQAEFILDEMETRGILRSISVTEKKEKDIHQLSVAYILLGHHQKTDGLI